MKRVKNGIAQQQGRNNEKINIPLHQDPQETENKNKSNYNKGKGSKCIKANT